MADAVIDKNLIYSPGTSKTWIVGRDTSGSGCGVTRYTTTEFNSCSATWRGVGSVTNWDTSSGTLFLEESGYNQYITDGSFVISGSTTIANGGIGGSHPYLSGVTIPSYVGAVNPSDSDWVAGVLALDVTYFTSATAGSDPSWIEGSEDEPSTPATTQSRSTYTISGGRMQ